MTNLDSSSMSLPTAINSTVSTMTAAKRGAAKLSFGCWETTANVPGLHRPLVKLDLTIRKNPKQSCACLGFRSWLQLRLLSWVAGCRGMGAARLA